MSVQVKVKYASTVGKLPESCLQRKLFPRIGYIWIDPTGSAPLPNGLRVLEQGRKEIKVRSWSHTQVTFASARVIDTTLTNGCPPECLGQGDKLSISTRLSASMGKQSSNSQSEPIDNKNNTLHSFVLYSHWTWALFFRANECSMSADDEQYSACPHNKCHQRHILLSEKNIFSMKVEHWNGSPLFLVA